MHRPFDIPVVCPACGRRFKLWQGGETDEIRQYLALMEGCRPLPWPLVEAYLSCFQKAPNRALKPARLKVLLSDIARMVRERGFKYDGAFIPCEPPALEEAIKAVIRAGKMGLTNHNYLKVVARGVAERWAAEMEAVERKREADLMAGRIDRHQAGAEKEIQRMDPETFQRMMKELREKIEKIGEKGRPAGRPYKEEEHGEGDSDAA